MPPRDSQSDGRPKATGAAVPTATSKLTAATCRVEQPLMARIAILGAGMMGSALSLPLIDRGHELRLIGTQLDTEIITALKAAPPHPTLRLPLPSAIVPFFATELRDALVGVDAIALGVSSAGVRWAGRALAPCLRAGVPLLMISKGLVYDYDGQRFEILPDVLKQELPAGARARRGRRGRPVHRRRARAPSRDLRRVHGAQRPKRERLGRARSRSVLSRVHE